jgi:OPA family glycerol-3-phosphate transporter-like MFS transporter
MLTEGYTEDFIGWLSFAYMLMYALGQLVNGRLGDRIRPRWMVLMGLSVAGAAQVVFPFVSWNVGQVLCFAVLGYGLSMLRGPLVKVISENTLPQHARWCCVGLSIVSYAGPLVATLLSIMFRWRMVFIVGGGIGVAMGVVGWLMLTWLEASGAVKFNAVTDIKEKKGFAELFKLDRFVLFMMISAMNEISTTTIDSWVPTYLVQHLNVEVNVANLLYSVIAVIKALCPVLCMMMFRWFRESDTRMLQVLFLVSTTCYAVMRFVALPIPNIALFILALMATSISSSVLWSIYIPSLAKSGQVSSANGVLDFSGYVGAAIASLVVANAIKGLGWNNTIWVWCAIAGLSFLIVTLGGRKTAPPAHRL